jgi:hypothetical protein
MDPKAMAGLNQFELWMPRQAARPKKRAASTKPTATMRYGFVEASPSRALRDGEGTFPFNLGYNRGGKFIAS